MTTNENKMSRRSKLVVGALAMFAMGGSSLRADAAVTPEEGSKGAPLVDDGFVHAEGAEQVRASQTVHHFNVPAGTLAEVAAGIEKETGLKITVPARVADMASPGVTGVLTTQEALTAALKGTGASANFVSPEKVTLDLRAADQSVSVTADAEVASLKYTAPVRDLPQTLTVIPENVLQNTASTSLVDALRTVSGITFGAGEGGNPIGDRPYIRGVDSQSSTFVDNIRDIGSQSREVFDVDSIEISKGPSGGFVGRGGGGGAINLNSKMARNERFLNVAFSPGSAKFFRGTVDGETKVTNWMSARLNGMAQDTNVAGRDQVHQNHYGFAPALLFNLGSKLRLFTNYYDLRSNDLQDPGIPYNNPNFYVAGTAAAPGATIARIDGRPRIFQAGDGTPLLVNRNAFYGFTNRDYRYEKVKNVFGRAEYTPNEHMTVRNSYRYGKTNQDYVISQPDDSQGNIYYGLVYRRGNNRNTVVDTSIDQTDVAGSGKTGSIKHTFATGFEFARERTWNQTNTTAVPTFTVTNSTTGATASLAASRCPNGAGAAGGYFCTDLFHPSYDDPWLNATYRTSVTNPALTTTNVIVKNGTPPTRQRTITKSVYGFDTIQFLPQLQATLGVRYDNYDSLYRSAYNCVPTAAVPCSFATTNNLVNYQAGVVYKPLTATSIYGSVSSSATPPGNSLSQGSDPSAITSITNQALPPEKNRTEEVGVKQELFKTKALATLAWFQSDTENVRVTTDSLGTVSAVGARRIRGIDIGMTGYINRKWQVFGGYTYMNAILQHTGVTNVTLNGVTTAVNGLLDGRHFPNTPANSFSLTSYYQITRKLTVGGGVYANGKVYGADNPATAYTMKWVPGYARVDLYGGYYFNKHWELQGNLQNVGDKAYFIQAYTTHYAALGPGRQGRATLYVHF